MIITSCLAFTIDGKHLDAKNDKTSKLIKFPDNVDVTTNNDNLQAINPNQAIIAIQIINSTSSDDPQNGSNKKRTVETSLGYGGYQGNNFYYKTQDGKFEIYPYSQHDIPPRNNHGKTSARLHSNVDIQQAYSYIVGKKQQQLHHPQQQQHHTQNIYYPKQYQQQVDYTQYTQPSGYSGYPQHQSQAQPQPHTTLFSTINQGQISGLSPHIPTQFVQYPITPHGSNQQLQIPVIILRVYSDQLSHSNEIYPNLPATNPYASLINMINLQQLLNGYTQNNLPYTHNTATPAQISNTSPHQYLPSPQYEEPQLTPQTQHQYDLSLTENYPKSTHTQALIKPKKQYYKSSKVGGSGVSVTTPTGFSYKATPAKQTEYVYQNEAANQQPQYIAENQQYVVAQGNQYSVPVVGAPNYYDQSHSNVQQDTQYMSRQNQQSLYDAQQTVDYNEYIQQLSAQYTPSQSTITSAKSNDHEPTQYIYLNEAELANHGYVYKNPSTGEYMYYPSGVAPEQQQQQQQPVVDTKYSLPDPSSQHHHLRSTVTHSYTTPSTKVSSHAHASSAVTEKSSAKQYNYHVQNPRHTSASDVHRSLSSAGSGRTKKSKSSVLARPLVLAPQP